MNLQSRLKKHVNNTNTNWETIERDYIQSWIIAAIGQHEILSDGIIFKGGTCLKKAWFKDYRFSEDLDFTAVKDFTDKEFYKYFYECFSLAKEYLIDHGLFDFTLKPFKSDNPHPHNQAAFYIYAKMPWHREPLTMIKVEITREEQLKYEPVIRAINHEYDDELAPYSIFSYALEEIICEKFRGILQNREKFNAKGWARSRVRDFYDIWNIFSEYRDQIQFKSLKENFIEKCNIKDIQFNTPEQFLDQDYLTFIKNDWHEFLQNLTGDVPSFDETVLKVRRFAYELF